MMARKLERLTSPENPLYQNYFSKRNKVDRNLRTCFIGASFKELRLRILLKASKQGETKIAIEEIY